MYRPEPLPLSIWIVNPFDDIPGEGLPPLRYWSLARILAGRGHDVVWWSADWSHRRKGPRTPPRGLDEEEGFAVRLVAVRPYLKNVSLRRLRSHRDFGRSFERIATEMVAAGQLERPDVILASLPPLEGPEAAARLAQRLDATLVVDLMDVWPDTFARLLPGPEWLRRTLSPLFLGRLTARRRAIMDAADAISSCAESYFAQIPEAAVGDRPRHVCHLGAWVAEFPPPPRIIDHVPSSEDAVGAGGVGRRTQPLECVYAGSLEAGQDLDTLLAAVRQLSAESVPVTIHVAGTGRLEPVLRAAAETSTGSCRLKMHGLLGRRDYVRLLSQCDVGLVLVKPESLVAVPYKACDYAAAGLALVNALPGELERLVERYRAGVFYAAGRGDSLAAAITALAGDERRLHELRQGARRLAETELDREKTYARFADWLEGLPLETAADRASEHAS
jgi:glycosyltransferase involved in cell wall biosynthesis